MRSFSIKAFGCRANQAESFLWSDELQSHGWKYERDPSNSNLILVNTCTVTSKADSDVRKFIRHIARSNPPARVVVTGCYAQRSPEEFNNTSQVWKVYGNKEKGQMIQDLISLSHGRPGHLLSYRSRALVKIQDGCNFHCTFCIVPKVRGRSVSLKKDIILERIRRLVEKGYREACLTGIHLCSYGLDLTPQSSLLELLRDIEEMDGLAKLRLSSLDPRFLIAPLLEHITESGKICPHFHLSLQHGSDKILGLMGRRTTVSAYLEILAYLRSHSPRASLGADIMVGFPGEGEEEFDETLSFLERSPLTYFHVFRYSSRPWTVAASWNQVEEKTKKERASILRRLSRKKSMEFRQMFLEKEAEAIVIKRKQGGAEVLTSNYFKVFVPFCTKKEGQEVKVKIIKVGEREAEGAIVS